MKSAYISEIHISKNAKDLIRSVLKENPDVIATQKSLKTIDGFLGNQKVILTKDFDNSKIKNFISQKTKSILAVGGGTTIDIAKHLAFITKKRLVVIPTILSTNAFATSKICSKEVTRNGSIDGKTPDQLIVDLEILKKADKRFNIAGVGDILSIYTANHDWKLYNKEQPEKFNKDSYNINIANVALSLLNSLNDNAEQIKENSYEGLESLTQLLIFSGYITSMYGNGRPESGSEHLFANAVELNSNKHFLHGELVGLGTILMCYLQSQNFSYLINIINKVGLPRSLTQIGLTLDETINALIKAKDMKKDRYTILHKLNPSHEEFETMLKDLLKKKFIEE